MSYKSQWSYMQWFWQGFLNIPIGILGHKHQSVYGPRKFLPVPQLRGRNSSCFFPWEKTSGPVRCLLQKTAGRWSNSTAVAIAPAPAAAIGTMAWHSFLLVVTVPEQTGPQNSGWQYLTKSSWQQESLLKIISSFSHFFGRWWSWVGSLQICRGLEIETNKQ